MGKGCGRVDLGRRSLHFKLVLIFVLIIVLLMAVVLVFLVRGVQDFFTDQFSDQISSVVTQSELVPLLSRAADEDGAVEAMAATLTPFSGMLGIDGINRNYYILDGRTGEVLETSNPAEDFRLEITPNIMWAITNDETRLVSPRGDFMDIAIPILGEETGSRYIVYIIDNRQVAQNQTREIFQIIIQAVVIGFAVTTVISLIISKALLSPVQGMTKAAAAMADGDFSSKISVDSLDEIGILATTFNDMASQIENMIGELTNAEKMRREFVANVSHELRTPLTSIRTYAETVLEDPDLPTDIKKEFLSVIINESDRMTMIVKDLLDLSRFDSEKTVLSIEEYSIEMSVRNVYAAIALEAKRRDQVLNLELEWKLPKIMGDRARIEQVLLNIMANALNYTPNGGIIDVSSGSTDDIVWVKISDTGDGIPEEDLARVFERFYRVEKARSRESGGTGLGLSIAKDIVTLHGGDINLESKLGEGTSVTITLPIKQPQ
jgi:signal transduction histidine kinase